VFKDQNVYTLSAFTVAALGAGTGALLMSALAGLSSGMARGSLQSMALSAAFLGTFCYLAFHVLCAALAAVAPKPFLRPLGHPPETPLPAVDVIISLDDGDEAEAAAFSLAAAARMRYPADRLRLHVVAAGRAAHSCAALEQLAQSYGASWMPMSLIASRDRAAAQAFERTAGQLTLLLCAGEAPSADFLERVVGSFSREPLLGFVEAGHFLVDGDGARADTAIGRRMPADGGPLARCLLRGGVRPSPDWPSSAIWRRGALISAGGIARGCLDGEAMARIAALTRGWTRRIAPTPLIAVFAPRTVALAARAQGLRRLAQLDAALQSGVGVFGQGRPGIFFRTLTILTGAFAPFAWFVLLAAAPLAVLSGARLWGGEMSAFASYGPLGVLALVGLSAAVLSGWRHSAAAAFMEMAVQLSLLRPMAALIAGRTPKFPAQPAAAPVILLALSLAAIGFGGAKLAAQPQLALWLAPLLALSGLALAVSLGALGAIREPRQKRAAPRLPAYMDAELIVGTRRLRGHLADISIQGARFVAEGVQDGGPRAVGGLIRVVGPHGPINLPVQLSRAAPEGESTSFGLRFTGRQLIAFAQAVTLVYRSQARFAAARDARGRAPNGVLATLRALANGLRALVTVRSAQTA
jgi:hypothetical protein